MNSYYLTDKIFLKDSTLFYETEKGDIKQVKNHNWHHILSDYGWTKLPKKWITILNKFSESRKGNNSLFGLLKTTSLNIAGIVV